MIKTDAIYQTLHARHAPMHIWFSQIQWIKEWIYKTTTTTKAQLPYNEKRKQKGRNLAFDGINPILFMLIYARRFNCFIYLLKKSYSVIMCSK